MFVRSLRLSGFKSFADPSILEFQPGINVIVGPNGAGKSNIADALSWVLGSQAPSTLRGAAMEDVIFAGSESRPRLATTEVELTFDNSSGVLPLEVSEVTISRFTDRAGASEYRINGAPCRLLDITELLSDTGIGRSLHSLVGQGQLDQVLQARPEDRRTFIEEAAQIGKYRRRKERSLRKIEKVDDNLLRLNDVLAELKRALRPLKRQAGAASAYSELMTEYQDLRQRLAATEFEILSKTEAELDVEGQARRADLLSDELSSVRARLTSTSDEREQLAAAAEKAQGTAHRIARAADRLDALGRLARERAARLSARLTAETEEGYRERIRLLSDEHARWQAETERLSSEARALTEISRTRVRAAAAARSAREECEQRLALARSAEIEATQALVRAEGSESASRATIESFESRAEAALERRELAKRELGQQNERLETARRASRELERDLDDATSRAARAEDILEQDRMRSEELKEAMGRSRAHLAAAEARLAALQEVGELLVDIEEAGRRLSPLVDEARRRFAEATESEKECSRALREANDEVERRWQDVARLDEELRRLDALMSGAIDKVAETRRRLEAKEVEVAALDEELARVRDSLAGAQRAAVEERAALPAHRAAVEQAREAHHDADTALAAARAAEDRALADASGAEIEAKGAEERSLAARLRVEEAEAGIADARRALTGLEGRRKEIKTEMDRAELVAQVALASAGRAERWSGDSAETAASAREKARGADERLGSLRSRERELEKSLQDAVERRNRAEVKRAEARARADALVERSLDEWGLGADDLQRVEILTSEERDEAREKADRLERQMQRLGPVNPRAAEEYKEAEERQNFLMSQIEDLRSSKTDLLKVVREVDETIERVFVEAFENVASEFQATFNRLFPGGTGRLKLTSPDDILNSGIEIEARPPGKNVKKMSLLSGGERALVALAFLFAIFRSRPSPFYLLDEVEAALDDVNLQRFLTLVQDLREHAQVLIVTHQKRTMEAAHVLYGVSMARDGVSQVVAKRMEEAATSG
ncbi:MAG: AAA family ATPase [Actinomycetota bacterium]|nr:AAA family ATPase [Actinomycetota bacterium]